MLRVSGALRASSQVPLGLAVVFPVLDLGRTAGGIRIAAGHPLLGSPSAGSFGPQLFRQFFLDKLPENIGDGLSCFDGVDFEFFVQIARDVEVDPHEVGFICEIRECLRGFTNAWMACSHAWFNETHVIIPLGECLIVCALT